MRALLRVDGGRSVGMGHLVRTHALGRTLAKRDVPLLFATASAEAERWLRTRSEDVVRIDAEPGSPGDAAAVAHLAEQRRVDAIITDGYFFREAFLEALVDNGPPIAAIDDMAEWPFPTAFVVNGGLGSRSLQYHTAPATRLLVGPEYLLLRPEFARANAEVRPRVERVFLCFGGADPEDLTGRTVEAWDRLEEPSTLDVLVGDAYPHPERLIERARSGRARVHRDLDGPAVASLMAACDMAIASAGMVAGELAALGIPLVVAATSEDQRGNALALRQVGAGLIAEAPHEDCLVDAARRLLADPERRRVQSMAARALVDGKGSGRVATAILRGE